MTGVMKDREIWVGPGERIRSAWVDIDKTFVRSKWSRHPAAVERRIQELIQMGGCQPSPAPRGSWVGDRFAIDDGGHTWLALQTMGVHRIYVEWKEKVEDVA